MSQIPRILKAEALNQLGRRVPFNVADVADHCESELSRARAHAKSIVDQARADARQIQEQAWQAGHKSGYEAGRQKAADEAEQEISARSQQQAEQALESMLPALRQLIASLQVERDRWLRQWESQAIDLTLKIAEKITRQQIEGDVDHLQSLLNELLQMVLEQTIVEVKFHPDDLQLLEQHKVDLARLSKDVFTTAIVADASLDRGGVILRTQHGEIDASLAAQFQQISRELKG